MTAISQADGIELIRLKIGDRKAFSNAFGVGLTVPEIKPRADKALVELQELYNKLFH